MSDINIGQITEALNDKMDRDANNIESPRLPVFLVAKQDPSSTNNYTWYRKYSDGWVEQGGVASTGETAITFDIQMADTNYYPSLTAGRASAWAGDYTPMYYNKTTTGMTIKFDSESTDNCWEIKGMAAN